jgi:hypothetical protein
MPAPPEAPATYDLLLGDRHRAFGRLVAEQALGRRASLDVEVRLTETPAEAGNNELCGECASHWPLE